MAHPLRSYITTPNHNTDLRHFHGRIEQYDVLTGADSLDAFMRHCVSNRLLHDTAIPASPADDSPDSDVLRIAEYEVFSGKDDVVVHPVDEVAMEESSAGCWPSADPTRARPASGRLGLYLPYLPVGPDELEEQEAGPLIPWAHVLSELKGSRRIASKPEKRWRPGFETGEFQRIFTLLVKFFRGRIVEDDEQGAGGG